MSLNLSSQSAKMAAKQGHLDGASCNRTNGWTEKPQLILKNNKQGFLFYIFAILHIHSSACGNLACEDMEALIHGPSSLPTYNIFMNV